MKKDRYIPFHMGMTVICFIFLICMSLTLVLYCRPIYYLVIDLLNIPEKTGYSFDICKQNYNTLIDYNLLFGPSKLVFPHFPMSASGESHFVEVKTIFITMQTAAYICLPLLVGGYIFSKKKKTFTWLKTTIIFALSFVVVIGGAMLIDGDWAFVMMHKILFNNNDWIFSEATDPIIRILPETFFLTAGGCIIGFTVIGLVICGLLYYKNTGSKNAKPAKTTKSKAKK